MNPSKMKYFKNNYSVSSIVIVMLSGRWQPDYLKKTP